MIDLAAYMKNNGVSKKEYVIQWIEKGLIPGVIYNESSDVYLFPESARRPYKKGALKAGLSAEKIRAHIVNAALLRRYISAKECFMSDSEFKYMINDLVKAGLIQIRIDDDIEYYDSTTISEAFKGKPLKEIRSFVQECIKAGFEGTTKAVIDKAFSMP